MWRSGCAAHQLADKFFKNLQLALDLGIRQRI
jgi:hypothetical protein